MKNVMTPSCSCNHLDTASNLETVATPPGFPAFWPFVRDAHDRQVTITNYSPKGVMGSLFSCPVILAALVDDDEQSRASLITLTHEPALICANKATAD